MGPCSVPFDSGGVCSLGPCLVRGLYTWYILGSDQGPILGDHRKSLGLLGLY